MMQFFIKSMCALLVIILFSFGEITAQSIEVVKAEIVAKDSFQTVVGFGASLAYYESWLIAHPNKNEIYEAIFAELSLDILRVRNAYEYDPGMIDRVREFNTKANYYLGKPISILSTSWGPPARFKSINNRKNGGTLKYTLKENKVEFDYSGFANWWNESLDDYANNGIYPTYISIQNEPEFKADWESCLLSPRETINSSDTIAGYNIALDSVYEKVNARENRPLILGPENVGIGYNSVENYVNALDVSKIDGIAHHLYHGVDENDPYQTTDMKKVGDFHPEIPHFQSEFSRGDWFSLGGLIYKSLHDENVVAYLYWDLIWTGAGLVDLDNPWDKNQWADRNKGYTKTKEFYAFKQFSAFIHPGWERIGVDLNNDDAKALTFLNAEKDSASFVVVNTSDVNSLDINLNMPGFWIDKAEVFITSESQNCESVGGLSDWSFIVPPHSIATVAMQVSKITTNITTKQVVKTQDAIVCKENYPNPFFNSTTLAFTLKENQSVSMTIFDIQGRNLRAQDLGVFNSGNHTVNFQRKHLSEGLYFYHLRNSKGDIGIGRFLIKD